MPILITFKSKQTVPYDLTQKADIALFKRYVTGFIHDNDIAQLTTVKNQLESIPNKSPLETEQLNRISAKLQQHVPLAAPTAPNQIAAPAIRLTQPAPAPQNPFVIEDGETCFQTLYAHLMIDMTRYTGNIDHLIAYSAIVLNMFMHAATFTPHDGHGKAQLREFKSKSQLQYYRSQGNHAQAAFFKALTQKPGNTDTSRLPFNEGFTKLMGSDDFSPDFCAKLKKINQKTGYPKPGEKVDSYVMTQIAHAGARKNNFSTLIQGMHTVVDGLPDEQKKQAIQRKLREILPPTKAITELSNQTCSARINALLTQFNHFANTNKASISVDNTLSSHVLNYRTERVTALTQRITLLQLKHIKICSEHHQITSLLIQLYPTCLIKDDTYKEGVTNVLLSIFGALLNHHAQRQGLHLYTERRQSFGFFRPTLSDAGCLILRLSLGLEPKAFDNIVVLSLTKLDDLLEKFKFDKKIHASVSRVFDYCEPLRVKEEGKRKPRETDTYIRSVVRKDNLTLTTFRQAKAYIDQAAEQPNNPNYLDQAMTNYLEQYIRQGIALQLRTGPQSNTPELIAPITSPIVGVLKNTLVYAYTFASHLTFLPENEPIQQLCHVYLHSLLKLLNKCQAGQSLLNDMARMAPTEFHYQALSLTEDILEYLMSLDSLRHIQAALRHQDIDPIAELRNTELAYANKALAIPKEQLHLFFTDSGQQAITTTLLTLSIELHGPAADGRNYDGDIHLFGNSYYEVAEFISDCKKDKLKLEMRTLHQAKIVFVDISELVNLPLVSCTAMKALVIDMTHHPLFDQPTLKNVINTLRQQQVLVALVESSLKHAQLGMDKYQAGKIIIISPSTSPLSNAAKDLFETVSRDAMHPSTASYLSMVNAIGREKVEPLINNQIRTATVMDQRFFSSHPSHDRQGVEKLNTLERSAL